MDILHFICLPTEEHLGCFQFGLLMNKAAIHIWEQTFVWTYFFCLPGSICREEIAGGIAWKVYA